MLLFGIYLTMAILMFGVAAPMLLFPSESELTDTQRWRYIAGAAILSVCEFLLLFKAPLYRPLFAYLMVNSALTMLCLFFVVPAVTRGGFTCKENPVRLFFALLPLQVVRLMEVGNCHDIQLYIYNHAKPSCLEGSLLVAFGVIGFSAVAIGYLSNLLPDTVKASDSRSSFIASTMLALTSAVLAWHAAPLFFS